jgi:hypothetical protein
MLARDSESTEGFSFFILSVDPRGIGSAFHRARKSERINHTPCGQDVYVVIAPRNLYPEHLVNPVK